MIRSISLENFKSWKQIRDMRFAPITGLFGPNSSGKTSILQWLLLQKQTVESTDRRQVLNLGDEHSLVDLGSFRDIVYNHEPFGTVAWTLLWDSAEHWRSGRHVTHDTLPSEISFDCAVRNENGPILLQSSYTSSDIRALWKLSFDKTSCDFQISGLDMPCSDMEDTNPTTVEFPVSSNKFYSSYDYEKVIKITEMEFSFNKHYYIMDNLIGFEMQFERLFERVHYLGPLREDPRRFYSSGRGEPANVGRRGEKVIEALLASRTSGAVSLVAGEPKSLEEVTAHWLRELKLIDSFSLSPVDEGGKLYQVLVRKTSTSTPVPITDVGFGVSQILPIIVLCYYVPKGSIVIFEQPEIHLHPSVQSGLADVFIDAIKSRGIQIVLESHSEHLLRRLQRRVAEDLISKDDVALYFCGFQDDQSRLTPLDVDPLGNITNWPKDFFGDELGEMAAMTTAAMERLARAEES